MQPGVWSLIFVLGARSGALGEETSNPLGKVFDLLDSLTAKVKKDGEAEAKAYNEYIQWCDDTSKNTQFAIDTSSKEKSKLEAKITELSSDIEVATSKIDELASSTATAASELKKATSLREREHADFKANEKEMMEALDALGRAVGVLEEEMGKHPGAFTQVSAKNVAGALQGLSAVLDAAAFSSKDQKKLVALVQSQQAAEDEDSEPGAPAAAAYKSQSGGIVDVLQDMKEKAESQLSELRQAEVKGKHNFEMLKQSLEMKSGADMKDLDDEKAARSAAEEGKATAEGDLERTAKELANNQQELQTAQSTCIKTAADHEASLAARAEELSVLAKAKKILQESSSSAASLLQVSSASASGAHTELVGSKVFAVVRRLAKQQHSAVLSQLASRIKSVLRMHKEDPFGKVKGLIEDMLAKLQKEAEDDATEKAYCDEQMAKTEAKKSDLDDNIAKLTSDFDQATARSAELKQQVQELQNELSVLAKEQAKMDSIRREAHEAYVASKADLEKALGGLRKALDLLGEYYGSSSGSLIQDDSKFNALMQQPAPPQGHSKSTGAGGGIIDILEVCESDAATTLAKEEAEEQDSESEHNEMTQENEVTKTRQEQDVKYKTQELKSLKTTLAELSADRESANTELAAVEEYYSKVKDRCIAKPETYADRKARRTAEIKGLKEALSILEDETALVQRKMQGRFRGSLVVG